MAAVVVGAVVEEGVWLVAVGLKANVLPPAVEAAGVLVDGAVVADVGLKLNIVVDGAVEEVLGCEEVVAGVVDVDAPGRSMVKPAVVLAAGVVVDVVLGVVLVVEAVGVNENDGVVVEVAVVVDAGVVAAVVVVEVVALEAGVALKLKLVVEGVVVDVVLACDEEVEVVPIVVGNENAGVVVEVDVAVVLEAAGVVVLVVDGCDELAVGKLNETVGALEPVVDPVLVLAAGAAVVGIVRSNCGFSFFSSFFSASVFSLAAELSKSWARLSSSSSASKLSF